MLVCGCLERSATLIGVEVPAAAVARRQALGDFVEGVGELFGAAHVGDLGEVVAHGLDVDAVAEDRALALDNRRAST